MNLLINNHRNSAIAAAEPGGILRLDCSGTVPGPITNRKAEPDARFGGEDGSVREEGRRRMDALNSPAPLTPHPRPR